MKLYYLIYISKATRPIQQDDLLQLLDQSKSRNETLNLTGMLLYLNRQQGNEIAGRFIQLLEGNKADVHYVFEKIRKDERHHHVMVINEGNIAQRNFKTWSMGFETMDMEAYESRPGHFELNDEFLKKQHSLSFSLPLNFLKSFYMMGLGKTG